MATSTDERTFQLATLGGAAALAAILFAVRFCGGVSMPAKPPPPHVDTAGARDVLASHDATPLAYKGFLENDAHDAQVPVPTVEAMGKKLVYTLDENKRGLQPGDPPVEVGGLKLQAVIQAGARGDDLVLVIQNPSDVDLAYDVVTAPSYGTQACGQRRVLALDANVVAHHSEERRSECVYRDGMVLGIEKVETLQLSPLEAYYVSRVPPLALGLDVRLAAGHKPGAPVCNISMSQSIRAAIENGTTTWRDLVDFYARHRCDTYQFPDGYRAFSSDGEHPLPVVSVGG